MTSINRRPIALGKFLDISWHMILPTLALSITSWVAAHSSELLDVRQDYIQTARAKGLPENRVIYVHANAVNPLIRSWVPS